VILLLMSCIVAVAHLSCTNLPRLTGDIKVARGARGIHRECSKRDERRLTLYDKNGYPVLADLPWSMA